MRGGALILGAVMLPAVALAYDDPGMYVNFKRVGLDLATSKVSNYREYEGSPNTEINQNTQGVLKGVFEFENSRILRDFDKYKNITKTLV